MSKTYKIRVEESIISILKVEGRLSLSSLLKKIRQKETGPRKAMRKEVRKILQDLEREKIVDFGRKGISLLERERTFKGKFVGTRNGGGFVTLKNGEEIFIPQKFSNPAMHGDLVEIILEKDRKSGRKGSIVKVLQREKNEVIGYLQKTKKGYKLNPIDRRISPIMQVSIPFNFQYDPSTPVRVSVNENNSGEFIRYENLRSYLDLIINEFELRREFPENVIRELKEMELDVLTSRERINLKNERIITIDNDTAKDFDDAVNVKKLKNGNFLLGVHIADVSHYVRPGTSLDREAFLRSTSVYFPELVLPMLPEPISNGICSLNPQEDRLTMSVVAEIRNDGRIVATDIFPSFIKSKARMTYSNVEKILNGENILSNKEGWLTKELYLMKELAEILWKKRSEEGSIDFDLPEHELSLDSMGKIMSMDGGKRLFSERIIEEFMLVANRIIAEYLYKAGVPAIYRIHEPPDMRKVDELIEMLRVLGIPYPKNGNLNRFYQEIISRIMEKENGWLLQIFVLKSLKLAKYSPVNKGHFGLAFEYYTHFTSPIRRYPDLIVHRILKSVLGIEGGFQYKEDELNIISNHSSLCERNGDQAEEELLRSKIMEFMKSKVGEEVEGFISYLGRNWIEVALKDFKVDGKILLTDLKENIYFLNRFIAKGKRTGKLWRMGDKIKATIASANPLKREIILYPLK
ncbi:MAG: ribonuclease R [Candidatus Aminicenantia bacterium]